jgi:hypothetical protein
MRRVNEEVSMLEELRRVGREKVCVQPLPHHHAPT